MLRLAPRYELTRPQDWRALQSFHLRAATSGSFPWWIFNRTGMYFLLPKCPWEYSGKCNVIFNLWTGFTVGNSVLRRPSFSLIIYLSAPDVVGLCHFSIWGNSFFRGPFIVHPPVQSHFHFCFDIFMIVLKLFLLDL